MQRWILGLVLVGLATTAARAEMPVRIVALGHSAFAGQGGPSPADLPAQLEAALAARGYDVVVANAGVWGDTTRGVLRRLDQAVPDGTQIVLLHIGVNDRAEGRPRPEWELNTDLIVARIRAKGVRVIQFREGPPAPPLKYVDEGGTVPLVEVLPDRIVIPSSRRTLPPEAAPPDGSPPEPGNKAVVDRVVPVVERVILEMRQSR